MKKHDRPYINAACATPGGTRSGYGVEALLKYKSLQSHLLRAA